MVNKLAKLRRWESRVSFISFLRGKTITNMGPRTASEGKTSPRTNPEQPFREILSRVPTDLRGKMLLTHGPEQPLGKTLSGWCHLYVGIAQIAITPPSHSNGHSGALFFRRDFTIFYHFYHFLPFCLWISAPNHPGKGLDPPKIKQMPLWTWKILL